MSIETKGQLIQYTNENDPNSAVNYYPYTVVDAVFTDEGKTKTLMEYLQEEILGTENNGGALGVKASTVDGGAVGENAKSDSGFAGGKNSKTTNGGAIGLNSIAENGGAVGEKASTLLRTSSLGVKTDCFLNTDTTYEKQFKVDLIIANSIKNEAKNINISKAYIKGTRGENIKNYFSIQMNNTETTASKIVATIYTREEITTSPASEYFSIDGRIPIYVDIEYQIEDGSGGSGFSGGYNSKASTGGGVGANAETISGGAIGQNADSDYGGAVGQNANTTAGCAVGLVDSSTRWGGAAGFMSESEHGYAGGWGSCTKSGGSIGMHASSENGGAVGYDAKTKNGFAGGFKARVGFQNNNTSSGGAAIGYQAKVGLNLNDDDSGGGAVGQEAEAGNGFAGGFQAKATGTRAIAIGALAEATGELSVQLGEGINKESSTLKFRTHKISNGEGTLYGTLNSNNADIAEYFEWENQNLKNKNRRGYFVTLVNDKIRLANSKDDYILGVISSEDISSVIGNTAVENWTNKYLKNVYGDFVLNEQGEKIINPEYNEKQTYIPRKDRKEWDVVCLIGQIIVNDDGTCEIGKYCKVNDNGEATLASQEDLIKYKVLKRLGQRQLISRNKN